MKGLPYYKAYPRDFIEGTIGMPFELKSAYRLVLDLIYMQGGRLPDDERYISGMLGCTIKKWRSLRGQLISMGKITVDGDVLTNFRADIELGKSAEVLQKLQRNGSKGGVKRAENLSKFAQNSSEISSKLPQNFAENEDGLNKNNELTVANATQARVNTDTDISFSSFHSEKETRGAQAHPLTVFEPEADFENSRAAANHPPPQEPIPEPRRQAPPPDGEVVTLVTEPPPRAALAGGGGGALEATEKPLPPANTGLAGGVVAAPPDQGKPSSAAVRKRAEKAQFEREFEEVFWPAVVRKIAKAEARKAFPKARAKASLLEIMAGLERYQDNLKAKGTDIQFFAYPATFLNGERWADEPAPIVEKYHGKSGNSGKSLGEQFAEEWVELDRRLAGGADRGTNRGVVPNGFLSRGGIDVERTRGIEVHDCGWGEVALIAARAAGNRGIISGAHW